MSDKKREIDDLRQEMARLDAQLLTVLEKRARASRRVGELRRDLPPSLPLHDRASIRALVARGGGDMPAEAMREIFREVYAVCLALELPVKVAFVGLEGGPGHAAARSRFASPTNLIACDTAAAALDEVTRRRAEFAVVAMETSTEGPVQTTIAELAATDLKLAEVVEAAFDLHLVNRTGNLADIEKVYATATDHALCQKALDALGSRVAVLDVKSPLMACQLAAEDHGAGALTTETFGAQNGLDVARRSALDTGSDRVRYAVVGSRPSGRTGSDATALVFALPDSPGALLDALKQLAERGINLTKIHSMPIRGDAWAYLFYAEVSGHFTDRTLVSAIEDLKRQTKFFKVLGSYPTAT